MSENIEKVIPNVDSKSKEERNVPDLRFPNYIESWHSNTIDELFTFLTNNTLSRSELNYINGSCKNIHYGDILTKFTTLKDVNDSDVPFINNNIICNYDLLHSNDIVIADTAEDYLVGKAIEIKNSNNVYTYSGLHTIPLRPKIKFASGFMAFNINSYSFRKRIHPLIQGIKVYSISKSALLKTKIYFPSFNEQSIISRFIQYIEERILTQKKIIEDYKLLLNAIRYIKLNHYDKNSEHSKLSDFLIEYCNKTNQNNLYPVLSSTKDGIFFQTDYFNKEAASEDTTGYKIVPRNYCTYRSMSDTGYFTFNKQDIIDYGIISPAYPVFTSKINNDFLIEYLNNSFCFKSSLLEMKEGGTRFALSFSKLLKLKIVNISIDEQVKYIKIINTYKNKIINEEKILSLLEKQKQYLLDKMFI